MPTIRMRARNEAAVTGSLERFIARLTTALNQQAKEPTARMVRQQIGLSFDRQGVEGGPSWGALAESTVLDRVRKGYPARTPILIRTGDYKRSITDPGHPQSYAVTDVTPARWRLVIGSTNPLLTFHEGGTRRMPARPALRLGKVGRSRVKAVISRSLSHAL